MYHTKYDKKHTRIISVTNHLVNSFYSIVCIKTQLISFDDYG
jgi:hypothetical protein